MSIIEGLILNIILGEMSTAAGCLFFPVILITIAIQFAYNLYLHQEGFFNKDSEAYQYNLEL